MNREEKRIFQEMTTGLSRRNFMRATGGAALAALGGSGARAFAGTTKIEPRADSIILLWMAGGMAQTETFDPKRYTPYKTGLPSNSVLSTFPNIPTR